MTATQGLRTARNGDDGPTAAVERLQRAPLDELEDVVKALKAEHTLAQVRQAMVERIARAPLAEFDRLTHIYLKHCGGPER